MPDDEDDLAAEIRASDDEDARVASPTVDPPQKPRSVGRRVPGWVKVALVFAVLGVGVTFLLWGTEASDAFVYSKLVNEVMEDPDQFRGRELRVEGQLRQGSVVFEAEPSCEHRFVLEREGHELPVRFPRCVVPDTFRDDMPMDVVVQGQLQEDDTFLANEVIPRCPSKYEMRERQQDGEEMPHSAVPSEPT